MTPPIRFSVLAGVSSDDQTGDDKGSIDDQIATCRRAIANLGGVEVDCFIMDGYSRSGYDSLDLAMREIPPLSAAIRAAEADLYDVLILDNYDRLGDLGQLVSTRFKKHRKQLYSARQSGRVHDPATYDPYDDEHADINIHVEGIIQRYRQNKLRRGLKLGIQRRVEMGRYSHNFPMGYVKNAKGDLEIDPPLASLIIEMKDKFLAGASTTALAKFANTTGVRTREGGKWHATTIWQMLRNPFYAGKVFRDRWKLKKRLQSKNGKANKEVMVNPSAVYYNGAHKPLWTWDEHVRILQELSERHRTMPRHNLFNFSGLLVCSVCSQRLAVKRNYYRCQRAPDHIKLLQRDANQLIGRALAAALRSYDPAGAPMADPPDLSADTIAALERQIAKVQNGFEHDLYTAEQAKEKIDGLRGQIAAAKASQSDRVQTKKARERLSAQRAELLPTLDHLPAMFDEWPPERNNRMLRDILQSITVTPEQEFTFHWRE